MKKLLYISLALAMSLTSCKDYLEVDNKSKLEDDFIFNTVNDADQAVLGAYTLLRSSGIHSNGLFYDMLSVSSDYELGPEVMTNNGRYNNENFYPNTVNIKDGPSGSWDAIYKTINRCNMIMKVFENDLNYQNAVTANQTNDWTHMYGEMATIRAIMYYELTRVWGDVIYSTAPIEKKEDYEGLGLVDRCTVQEGEINKLRSVESLMYSINQGGRNAERLTKGAAHAVIARLAMLRGGYALRRPDADMTNYETPIQQDGTWGKMARRSDWKDWYKIANEYLKKVKTSSGARFITEDGGTGNAFQKVFQYQMDLTISPESIYEVAEVTGNSTERPYAFGRPSGGGSTAYPPKAYGQIRFLPWFYWGAFDPSDLRRDVTVAVTGLSGTGTEVLIPWNKGNVTKGGGIALNKWDYSRMVNLEVTCKEQRKTGINATYIRLSDMLLLLAETEAYLAKEGEAGYSIENAKIELNTVRSRAFTAADKATKVDAYLAGLATADKVIEAVQNERMFELAGEGQRKYDLVRWGIIADKVNQTQKEMAALLEDLNTKGFHAYDNGQQFPAYVYIKEFSQEEANTLGLKNLLTKETPRGVDTSTDLYAMQYPGWRGNTTDWKPEKALTYKAMAIKGLFKYIPEGSAEHNALIQAGYTRTPYGIGMLNERNNWDAVRSGTLGGYLDGEYTAKKPVRYLQPIPESTITYSNGQISNSYGFPNI